MEQKYKPEKYYYDFSNEIIEIIDRSKNRIETNYLKPDRIPYAQRGIASNYLKFLIANYTFKFDIIQIKNCLINAINYTNISWNGFWKLKNLKGVELNQYILSAYDEMIWMLSLSYLLNIPDIEFHKLVDVIDSDNVKDFLFEFIITTKLQNRKPIEKESYQEYFGVPKVFEKLRLAIKENDKHKAEMLVEDFLNKDWYRNHKEVGWYNSHKSKYNTYFGYWSFESAVVVVILDLDDSKFRNNEYYPKDLVDYYRANRRSVDL
ncbi:MAG: PoNe immunity protein domain-containing protein [Putridiphycobacter sp.]